MTTWAFVTGAGGFRDIDVLAPSREAVEEHQPTSGLRIFASPSIATDCAGSRNHVAGKLRLALPQSELVTAPSNRSKILRRGTAHALRARPRRRGMSSGRSRKPRTGNSRSAGTPRPSRGMPARASASVGDRTSPRPTSGIFPREKCFAGGRALGQRFEPLSNDGQRILTGGASPTRSALRARAIAFPTSSTNFLETSPNLASASAIDFGVG